MIVVQETEYTGAGKHPMSQLAFAKRNGIDVIVGDPEDEVPGESIVIPAHPDMFRVRDVDLTRLRRSALRNIAGDRRSFSNDEMAYMATEVNLSIKETEVLLETLR